MKASNIFQSLRSKGVCGTDGIPPKLPGVSSPLDKKLVGDQKNLNPELRAAIEDAPESPTNYGSALKNDSDKKYGKLIKQKDLGGGRTKSYYEVPGSNMPKIVTTQKTTLPPEKPSSMAKKKGCKYKK